MTTTLAPWARRHAATPAALTTPEQLARASALPSRHYLDAGFHENGVYRFQHLVREFLGE